MTVLDALRKRLSVPTRFLATDDSALHECRRCGTSFDTEPEECPRCGTDSIASYHPSTFR